MCEGVPEYFLAVAQCSSHATFHDSIEGIGLIFAFVVFRGLVSISVTIHSVPVSLITVTMFLFSYTLTAFASRSFNERTHARKNWELCHTKPKPVANNL